MCVQHQWLTVLLENNFFLPRLIFMNYEYLDILEDYVRDSHFFILPKY